MGTVGKALSLLGFFDADRAELALAELARLSGFDKATTRRLLLELSAHGFVEQNPASRAYRIGPGALRLARLRSERFPLIEVARPLIEAASEDTGETVHLSELAGGRLSPVLIAESSKANRVNVSLGQVLPFNSTASGLAVLAFAPADLLKKVLAAPLEAVTARSIRDPAVLLKELGAVRARGWAVSSGLYEDGVHSVAAPILGLDRRAVGAVSVTAPLSRVADGTIELHAAAARAAAARIAAGLFGRGASLPGGAE